MINLEKRLAFWAGLKPNEVAFVDGKKEITFAELQIHTLKVASVLSSYGVKSGDLVCTVLSASLDWPVILALQLLGATSFAKPGLVTFDLYAAPDWLIAGSEHPHFSKEKTILVNESFAQAVNDSELFKTSDSAFDPARPIRLSSTSGTSGEVKYLAFTESEIYERLLAPSVVNFVGNGKFLNLMLFGAAQSYNWAHRALLEGKTFYTSKSSDEGIFEMLAKYGIATIYGSPQQISVAAETIQRLGHKLSGKFNLVLGGSAPSMKLLENIRKNHNSLIINSLGSAETGFIAMLDFSKENSRGLVIHPNSVVEVLDENKKILNTEEVGILRYKIPGAANSYFNNLEASKSNFEDGYFYSGDMGYKTLDGRLFITGRSNEVINLGGVKVNPEQIDEIVLSEPGIADAAAFALDDESGVPKLAIALVVDNEFDEAEFVQKMKGKFTRAKIEGIFRVNAIPRNPNGKIIRRELNRKFSKQ